MRSHRHSFDPTDISRSVDAVHESLNAFGLRRERLVVIGGAALAMHGIRTANDVDGMTTGVDWLKLRQERRTMTGAKIAPKLRTERLWLELSHASAPLDMDLTTHMLSVNENPAEDDAALLRLIGRMPRSSDGWHYLGKPQLRKAIEVYGERRHQQDMKRL